MAEETGGERERERERERAKKVIDVKNKEAAKVRMVSSFHYQLRTIHYQDE